MFNRFRRVVLFLVGLSVPIQGYALDAGVAFATPFKLATAVLFVLAMLQYATRSRGGWHDRKTLWMITFLVSFAVATTMALVAGLPAPPVLRSATTIVALISFYFLLGYVLETREDVILLLWALVIGGAVTVVPAVGELQRFTEGGERFRGLAGQENLLGADMNVCLAAAAGLFFLNHSNLKRAFLVGAAGLAMAGIAFSLSRSAFLALGAMFAFWLYRSGRRGNIQYAILAVMLGTAGLLLAPEAVYDRFGTIFDAAERARDGSIQGRFVINTWAIRAFLSNPLVGVGTPRFATWVHMHPGTESVPWHTVHNAYLAIASQQGLFGLVPFVGILWLSWSDYSACWRSGRARRQIMDPVLKELETLSLFLQLALLSGMVGGMFHQQHRSKTLWMMMALSPVVVGLMRERLEALKGPGEARQPIFPEATGASGVLPRPSPG